MSPIDPDLEAVDTHQSYGRSFRGTTFDGSILAPSTAFAHLDRAQE